MPTDIDVTVESFGKEHPEMNPMLLIEHARVALTKYHQAPASFDFHHGEKASCSAKVHFGAQILDQKARSNAKTLLKRVRSSWRGCC